LIGDGDLDLVLYFATRELASADALDVDSVAALLEGETLDGAPITGMDAVNVVKGGK
jgi:hypothetical protein